MASVWGELQRRKVVEAEQLIFNSQLDRNSGFTAHPEYLHIARMAGFIDLWEERGPPDFCDKIGDEWVRE
jgi:hypothetical protein